MKSSQQHNDVCVNKRWLHTDHVIGCDANTIISVCKLILKSWLNGIFSIYRERPILSGNIDQHCPLVAHLSHNLKIHKIS